MENEATAMNRLHEELKLLREQNSRMEALKTENERLKVMLANSGEATRRATVSSRQLSGEEFSGAGRLRTIDARYRSIFNTVPVSIMEMDFSAAKAMLDNLSKSGVSDPGLYFQENPGFLKQCAREIKIVDVNDATLIIYGAASKEQLLVPLDDLMAGESYGVLAGMLVALSGGSTYFEAESESRTLSGEVINVLLKISLPSEDILYDRVIVCIVDVTIRKRMVNGFIQHRRHLENLVDKRTGEMERLLEELTKENNFRRQMEIELKQSEETLKTLLDAIQESAFLLDTDYRIVQCNKTGAGRLGRTPEELIGNVIDSVLPYEITAGSKTKLKNVFITGRPFKYKEIREGKVYDATCHPIIDWKKDVYMVALFLQDITDREMTYYALRESEDRFRKIFEEGPLGMALVGLDLHPVKVNGMLCRMLGHSEDALKSMFVTDFIHPDDVDKCLQLSKELYMGHIPYCKGENRFLKKDGATTWGNLTLSILPNKLGEPQYFLAMIEDISKRKTSEEHLRHSEKTLKALIDSVEESVLLLDTDLNVIKCNGTFAGRLNISEDTMIDINLYNIMPSAFTTFVKDQVERLVRTKKKIQFETNYKDSFFEVTCYPLMDEDGGLSKFTVFARDVTDRKKLEEHLRMYQKLDFIGKLAGGIAHDINNSITAISSAVYFLRKYLSHGDPLLKYVDNIHNAAERATIIAKGLLTFSRKQVIHPKPIDCSYVVSNISNLIDRLIGEDVTVETFADKRGLMIMADANQIELCIMNLAFNARDAMPEGGTLTIRTGLREMDAELVSAHNVGTGELYAIISVSDTGTGMDNETAGKVFEPFFTTKDIGKGTGLGLASVYGAVKQNNGFIEVKSEPGAGTVFHMYFPLLGVDDMADVSADEPIPEGSETLLIAEDDPGVRELSKDILESSGYKIYEAASGDDAVSVFAGHKDAIQLVILDVVMPGMSGKKALREIRKINPGVKALYISGYSYEIVTGEPVTRTEAQGKNAGKDLDNDAGKDLNKDQDKEVDFISKPISPMNMLKKIREVLDR